MAKIVVVGSLNMDLVAIAPRIPVVGETKVLSMRGQIGYALSVSLLNPHAIIDTVGVIGTNSLHYGSGERWAFAAATAGVFAGAMFDVAYVAPGISYTLPARFALALALGVLGGAVALAEVVVFRIRRTTVNPLTPSASSSVVSSGVHRLSRNPV